MSNLTQRLDALEAIKAPSDTGPRMILIVGLTAAGHRRQITGVTVGGFTLHRGLDEAEAAFIERVETVAAAVASPQGAPVLAFAKYEAAAVVEA